MAMMTASTTPAAPADGVSAGDSYARTVGLFVAGGLVTAIFSGSLARLTSKASVAEVLAVGMVVPSFTWAVQLTAAALAMTPARRRVYWGDLGRVCLLGSVALLPAAVLNVTLRDPPGWPSVANVLASVAVMAVALARRSRRHGTPPRWPASWCVTIAFNMLLFGWVSRPWW